MLRGLDLQTVHLGLAWQELRDRYPFFEEQPAVQNEVEEFDNISAATLELKFNRAPTTPRLWLMEASRADLVQIQSDRIGFNWRRVSDDAEYPRYQHVRSSFEGAYDAVLKGAGAAGGRLRPSAYQCEVVYVNEVPAAIAGGTLHGDPHPVIRMWSPVDEGLPGAAEDVQLTTRHRLPPDSRTTGGRLTVRLQPVVRSDTNHPVYLLTLTVRGAPADGSLSGVLAFFDLGHEVIVRSFASLTTDEMHDEWGRTE